MAIKKKTVTKKEAATVQLETAIKLFFENRDLISAYTLCSAANGILEGIYKKERSTIMARQYGDSGDATKFRFSWNEEWEIRLKPEHIKEGFRLLNAAQNFFKHAESDHDATHEFKDWEETGIKIFGAVTNYNLVFGEISPAMNIFFTVYIILHPNFLTEDNPLFEHIVGNPLCKNAIERFSQSEIAAIGYSNLEKACPELFPPTDILSNLRPYSSGGTIRVPSSED